MKPQLLLTLLASSSMAGELPPIAYPDVDVISLKKGWRFDIYWKRGKELKDWSFVDEEKRVFLFDENNDGKIDWLKVTKPANSFAHYIWRDTDYDGDFDKSPVEGNLSDEIKVPQLPTPVISYADSRTTLREFLKGETKFDYSDRTFRAVSLQYIMSNPRKGEAWVYEYVKNKHPKGKSLRIFHYADGEIVELQ